MTHKEVSSALEQVFDSSGWSLIEKGTQLEPLRFSNGKTQEDVVNEIIGKIAKGAKVIFLHGVCGTGKSAIALNVARRLGKTSVVVPVKALQRQYERDYVGRKQVIKPNGKPLSIAIITGRDNHASLIKQGVTCADPYLPETIRIGEKNYTAIKDYYTTNPFIENKQVPELKQLKRISIAPSNPYWSPIVPAHVELNLPDARKKRYKGLSGKEFIFYHRKPGCGYYDQYDAYLDADVIVFNASKYKIETTLDRKPATKVDIIDEADEFLDSFAQQRQLHCNALRQSLSRIKYSAPHTAQVCDELTSLLDAEEHHKGPLTIREDEIFPLEKTRVRDILQILARHPELMDEAYSDETSYIATAYEIAEMFIGFEEETFLSYRRFEQDLIISLVTTNLSQQFSELIAKNNVLILMSGTLHSPEVLKDIFGISAEHTVEAETRQPGTIEIIRLGGEFDCKYSTFQSGMKTKDDYFTMLNTCIEKAPRPALVHVNAFEDLPTESDKLRLGLHHLPSRGDLITQQANDLEGIAVEKFKSGATKILFTTKCARGVDFPGEQCRSVIFTKYPNPNMNDTFWKILQKTHANTFWSVYRDKARREFLQRVYRAVRFPEDHVYVLSPDTRVLDAVRELQIQQQKQR